MKSSAKIVIGLLVLVSLGLAGFSGVMYMDIQDKEDEISTLESDYEELHQDYETLVEKTETFDSSFYFLTVDDYTGYVDEFKVTIMDGDGSLNLNIDDTVFGWDTQESTQEARDIADLHTEKDLNEDFDVNVDLDYYNVLDFLYGPSAGAAQTLAMISAANEKPIGDDVLITGTIERDGSIDEVGGVEEKAEAAEEFGAETILVPEGQSVNVPGISVVEVSHIEEAMEYVGLEPKDVTKPDEEMELELVDFKFVEDFDVASVEDLVEVEPIYEPHDEIFMYLDVSGFEVSDENIVDWELYITVYDPMGDPVEGLDTTLIDDDWDTAYVDWAYVDFTSHIWPGEDGWDSGEHEVEYQVVDVVGDDELTFTESFNVE